MQKTVVLPLQMCVARFSCFLQQLEQDTDRRIDCTAFLNWFAFVTEQYEYSDLLRDQTRLTTVKSGRRLLFVPKNILMAGFYLTAYDRGIPRVRFETSRSLFAIVQFIFAQDIKKA